MRLGKRVYIPFGGWFWTSLICAGICFGISDSLVSERFMTLGLLNLLVAGVHLHIWCLKEAER